MRFAAHSQLSPVCRVCCLLGHCVPAEWTVDFDLQLMLNAPLKFNLGPYITNMVMFKHEISFGMYAAALRCTIEPDYDCAIEIHEFLVTARLHAPRLCGASRLIAVAALVWFSYQLSKSIRDNIRAKAKEACKSPGTVTTGPCVRVLIEVALHAASTCVCEGGEQGGMACAHEQHGDSIAEMVQCAAADVGALTYR